MSRAVTLVGVEGAEGDVALQTTMNCIVTM